MRHSSRILGLVIACGLVLLSGVVHGYLDGRWTHQPDLREIGQKLNQLPDRVGDWELVEESELGAVADKILGCYGSTVREYWRPSTGDRINLAVLFGPRGPIAVHVPEVCYTSSGTVADGETMTVDLDLADDQHSLWKARFRHRDAESAHLEVWYAWSDGGPWNAAKYPRFWLTDRLYKLQVAGAPGEMGQHSPVREFLEVFLPVLAYKGMQSVAQTD